MSRLLRATVGHAPAPSPTSSRGPNGTHWPAHTPAYDTPHTHTASTFQQVESIVQSLQSNPDPGTVVIQMAAGYTYTGGTLTLTGGNSEWPQNILVRPPLGQRQSVGIGGQIRNQMHGVTFAGMYLSSLYRLEKAERSAACRFYLPASGAIYMDGSVDSGMYEIYAPIMGTNQSDRALSRALSNGPSNPGGWHNVNCVWEGCWLTGHFIDVHYVPLSNKPHQDTLQTLQVTNPADGVTYDVFGLTIRDSILFSASDKAVQGHGTMQDLRIENSLVWGAQSTWALASVNPDFEPPSTGGIDGTGYTYLSNNAAWTGLGTGAVIEDSDFVGTVSAGFPATFRRCNIKSMSNPSQGGVHTLEDTVVDSDFNLPYPTEPNLDDIWGT